MDNCRLPFGGSVVVAMRRDDVGVDGFDLVVEPAAARGAALGCCSAAGAVEVDAATAEVVRVEAGVPRFASTWTTTRFRSRRASRIAPSA